MSVRMGSTRMTLPFTCVGRPPPGYNDTLTRGYTWTDVPRRVRPCVAACASLCVCLSTCGTATRTEVGTMLGPYRLMYSPATKGLQGVTKCDGGMTRV
jgi:hypothetical protein